MEYRGGFTYPIKKGCESMNNADKIRSMSDEELTEFLSRIAYGRKTPWSDQFAKKFCSSCQTTEYKSECYLKPMHLHECDFTDGKCPNGNEIVWWLRQPCEGGNDMKENCAECKHHDVFWGGAGCILLNNGEQCKFEPRKQPAEEARREKI